MPPCSLAASVSFFFRFEVEFLSARPAVLPRSTEVYALKGPNAHTELSLLDLLGSSTLGTLPLLPALLGSVPLAHAPPMPPGPGAPLAAKQAAAPGGTSPLWSDEVGCEPPSPEALPATPAAAAAAVIRRFELNPEQAEVVRHVAAWAVARGAAPAAPPVCLCFGPFGCGKSTLLVAVMHLIIALRDMELPAEGPGGAEGGGESRRRGHALSGARVLVSAHTNVAVDRILLSLLDSGSTEFLRVGPLRRLDRRLLPHSLHASESKNAPSAAAELNDMLREGQAAGTLTPGEEAALRSELAAAERGAERHRRRLLKTVPVVGVTCCSALIPAMEGLSFDVVVLDECSQVIEPLALAPLLRGQARFLVAAGDPRQLPPLVAAPALPAGGAAATAGDDAGTGPQGLSRPLFVRLAALGASLHLLLRQYRCHPAISAIPNAHFYGNRLLDGCAPGQRPSLLPGLPNLVAVDIHGEERRRDGGSTYNLAEAEAVVGVVERALAAGVDPRRVGVICFFRAQVAAVRTELTKAAPALQTAAEGAAAARAAAAGRAAWAAKARRRRVLKETSIEADEGGDSDSEDEEAGGAGSKDPEFVTAGAAAAVQVATVDAFQGAEKDVIVLTTAATQAGSKFAGDAARLNVALTRARHNLVVVGHAKTLKDTAAAFAELLKAARATPGGYGVGKLQAGTKPAA